MKKSIVILALILSGCDASQLQSPAPTTPSSEVPASPVATEPVTPASPPFTGASIFSAWVVADNSYTVDLSSIHTGGAGPTIYIFGPMVNYRCHANTSVIGTETSGTLSISSSRSETGDSSVNDRYCHPINGFYQYTRIDDHRIGLCRAVQGCIIWVSQ